MLLFNWKMKRIAQNVYINKLDCAMIEIENWVYKIMLQLNLVRILCCWGMNFNTNRMKKYRRENVREHDYIRPEILGPWWKIHVSAPSWGTCRCWQWLEVDSNIPGRSCLLRENYILGPLYKWDVHPTNHCTGDIVSEWSSWLCHPTMIPMIL